MHEYSIVGALVDRVAQEVAAHPGARVKCLRVRIGELAGVEKDLLRVAYDTFKPATVCAGAELFVEAVAASWRCTRCEIDVPLGGPLRCPDCGRPARLVAGDEIILDRIELEVPDV